eukprot:2835028-Pleurochrysis_carterae.AAC.1
MCIHQAGGRQISINEGQPRAIPARLNLTASTIVWECVDVDYNVQRGRLAQEGVLAGAVSIRLCI